jgi:hypothetical protein
MACGICSEVLTVPTTNAAKHASAAWSATKETAGVAHAFVCKAYDDETKIPTTIECGRCNNVLGVPAGLFDWKCVKTGCPNANGSLIDGNTSKCPGCQSAQIEKELPMILCGICQNTIVVPRSNAAKHWAIAKNTVIGASQYVSNAVTKEYKYQAAKPVQFHCSKCSCLLALPTTNSGEPDLTVEKVMCAKCNNVVSVPKTNFRDSLFNSYREAKKFAVKGMYMIGAVPHCTCPTCNSAVEVPSNAQSLQCPKCKTVLG